MGEGKTSFINLVRNELKSENNKTEYNVPEACKILGCMAVADIEVLRWDPWYFSTKTDLGQQLYELIRPQCKLLAWERFIFFILLPFLVASCCFWILKYLDLVDHPTIFLTIFGIAFVVLSELYKKYPKNKFVPKYPFFSAAIIKKMFFLFKDPINSFIEQYQYNFDETKSSLKEITKDRKLLIVIDDVDRMEPNQVKQIFDLVNGIGNLPNVVYLIAFDKIVVSKAINPNSHKGGERYLSKLIHHSIPLWYDYQELIDSNRA
jgi:KAP family P-loop domain